MTTKCTIFGHLEPVVRIYDNDHVSLNVTAECPRCRKVFDIKSVNVTSFKESVKQ